MYHRIREIVPPDPCLCHYYRIDCQKSKVKQGFSVFPFGLSFFYNFCCDFFKIILFLPCSSLFRLFMRTITDISKYIFPGDNDILKI